MFLGLQRGFKFSLANVSRSSKLRPPSSFSRALGSPHLIVGKPCTPCSSQRGFPSVVQSTSATRAVLLPLYCATSLSQSGFMDLQWPHHGARNFTKTVFPAVSEAQVSGVSSVAFALTRAPTSKSSF